MEIKHHYIDLTCLLDLVTPALKMLGVPVDIKRHQNRVMDTYEYLSSHNIHDFIQTYTPYILQEAKVNEDMKEYVDMTLIHTIGIELSEQMKFKHIYHVNNMGMTKEASEMYSKILSDYYEVQIVLDDSNPIIDFDMFSTFIVYNGLTIVDYLSVSGDFVGDSVSDKLMLTPLFLQEIHEGVEIKLLMSELKESLKTLVNIEFIPTSAITVK